MRILRVPNTFNFKNAEPREVKVLGLIQGPVELSTIEDLMGDVVLQRPSYIPRGELDDVTKAILGNTTPCRCYV